jgi:flagellar motor switch protein FliN/FliY
MSFTTAQAAVEVAIADALVANLPGAPLLAQPHGSDPVPMQVLESGVSATYVGPRSADLAVILLDRTELIAAGGGGDRVRLGDVLRPALEAATDAIGGGQLGDAADGVPASLFQSADAVVFDLIGEEGLAGWFAIALRTPAPPRGFRDVSSRLGRISTVQMTLSVEIGRAVVSVQELLDAQPGTVIELDRAVGSEADVFLNGRMIAHGEIVVVDRRFAVRVTEVLDTADGG